jgi:hypothetical protein
MSASTEGLDDYLVERRIAIGALLDRMAVGDLTRVCSRPGITEAEVAAVLKRYSILKHSEAST